MERRKISYQSRELLKGAGRSQVATAQVTAATQRRTPRIKLHMPHLQMPRRATCLVIAAVLALITLAPMVVEWANRPYKMLDSHVKLLGASRSDAAANLKYSAEKARYDFMVQDTPATAAANLAGGRNPASYSVSLPKNSSDGITVTDIQSKLSVSLVPKFDTAPAERSGDRVVYPTSGGELAYTFKYDGLKEDIVVPKFVNDTLSYKFDLNLPNELSAKVETDGSIGIYSADPALFGNVSYGTTADGLRVQLARQSGPRTHLMFNIPKPIIKQSGSEQTIDTAAFKLDGEEVTLSAYHLKDLSYPIAVDPSFIVTSASDFNNGNNDGNVDVDTTNNQLVRGAITGGTISGASWTAGTSFSTNRYEHATIAARGYLYVIGGCTTTSGAGIEACANLTTSVQYATIGSGGSITSWNAATALPAGRFAASVATYNNRIYVIDGKTAAATITNTVLVADVNADGTLSAWRNAGAGGASSTTVTTAFARGAVASNGYLYVAGGHDGSSSQTAVEYAKINGDGSVGTWTASGVSLNTARRALSLTAYNGNLYASGGQSTGSTLLASTEYAAIQSNGSLNSWTNTTSMATTRFRHVGFVYNGYLYMSSGCAAFNGTACTSLSATTEYAPIFANGALGTWATTTSVTTARQNAASAVYGGNLFITGGCSAGDCTTAAADVQTAGISAAGTLGSFQSSADFNANGIQGAGVIAVRNTLYVIGGRTAATTYLNTVRRAPINDDGSLGTWVTDSTTFTNGRYGMAVAYVANNNQIYLFGGYGSCGFLSTDDYCQDVITGTIASNGSINALTTQGTGNNLPNAVVGLSVVVYRSVFYLSGGYDGSTYYNSIYYANPTSTGVSSNSGCGSSFCTLTSFTGTRSEHMSFAPGNGYLYVIGGNNGSTTYDTVQYAKFNTGSGTLQADAGCGSLWCTTTNMPQARTMAAGFAANGHLYISGGCTTSACGTRLNSTIYAPFNANGTLGSWQTTTNLSSARNEHGMAVYHGYVYVVGGTTGTYQKDTNIAPLNNGGAGIISAWNTTGLSALPSARSDFATVTYKNYIYVIGGCEVYTSGNCSTRLNSIVYAQVNSDGTTGSWTTATTLPETRSDLAAVVYGNRLYISGGVTDSGGINTDIKSIDLNPSTGALGGSWTTLTSFSAARSQHGMLVNNGYIYVLEGWNGTTTLGSVEYTTLSLSGTLGGSWTSQAIQTDGNTSAGSSDFINNGYLYRVGGNVHTTSGSNYGKSAPINSDGSIGTSSITSFNGLFARNTPSVVANGFVYMIDSDTMTAASLYNGGGFQVLGNERSLTANSNFASGDHSDGGMVYLNGYIYAIGGCTTYTSLDCTTMNNIVEKTAVQSIPRKGSYSRLLNGGGDFLPKKLLIHGSTAAGSGVNMSFSTATSVSPVLGSATTFDQSSLNSMYTISGATEGQYFYLTVTYDDTANALFPDSASGAGAITDYQLYFRPAPNKRLRGGATFIEGVSPRELETNP